MIRKPTKVAQEKLPPSHRRIQALTRAVVRVNQVMQSYLNDREVTKELTGLVCVIGERIEKIKGEAGIPSLLP